MPSPMHETLIDMVRRRPTLVADLLVGSTKVPIPDFHEARLLPGDFTVVAPTEYRADQVIALYGDGGDPSLAFVIEVQFGRDHDKRRSWPVYVTTAHARLGCPTSLVVMCLDESVARWCGTPIRVGDPDFVLTPTVVGPASVPIVDEPEELPAASKSCLEKEMTIAERQGNQFTGYYFTQAYKRGRAEGEAEGEAKGGATGRVSAILAVLAARDIEVTDQDRDRLTGCTDIAQLDEWVTRAATATSVKDLFD